MLKFAQYTYYVMLINIDIPRHEMSITFQVALYRHCKIHSHCMEMFFIECKVIVYLLSVNKLRMKGMFVRYCGEYGYV